MLNKNHYSKMNPYLIPGLINDNIISQVESAGFNVVLLTPNNVVEICTSIMNKLNSESVTPQQVKGKSRKKEVIEIRHFAAYHMKEDLNMIWRKIGLHFGGRDHSTAINSHRQWGDWIMYDKKAQEAERQFKRVFKL